jgi:hypothetical protein
MCNHDRMDTANLEHAARRYRDAEAALDTARTSLQTEAIAFLQQHASERGAQTTAANITGWSREHLRGLRKKAEEEAERGRREAEVEALRRKVAELSTPAPAKKAPPAPQQEEPSDPFNVSPEVAALSYEQARDLFKDAEVRHVKWAFRMRRTLGTVPPERRPHLGVQYGVDEGLIDLPDRPVSSEEKTG